MRDRNLMWGVIWSGLAALVVFLIPSGMLERFVVASGIALVIPAAAPPLGTTARLLLAAAVFLIGLIVASLLGQPRDEWEAEDSGEADDSERPSLLAAAEQMRAAPAPSTEVQAAIPPAATGDVHATLVRIEAALAALPQQMRSAELGKTLRSVQALLRNPPTDPVLLEAVRSIQPGQGAPDAVLARIEALEIRINEQFTSINDRLAMLRTGRMSAPTSDVLPLPRLPVRRPTGAAAQRITQKLADIRRFIDGSGG